MAERTGTIPNSHTVFSGFITPGRCLYITRTGLWLPVFKYYCPSGPRHVCHLKQIIACSSSLLCFKSCKKASTLPAELEMKMYDSSPNSQSGAIAAGSNGLLSPWELESEDLIFPNPLVTCYVQSTLPHSPALYFSSCLRSIFFLVCTGGWFCREIPWCTQPAGPPLTWTVVVPASLSLTAGTPCRRCSIMEQIQSAVLDSNVGTS